MKNNKKYSRFSAVGFLIFFATVWLLSTFNIAVFYFSNKLSNGNLMVVTICGLFSITLGALFCSFIDMFRRKKMVDEPVVKILEATEKIASGNFNIKLRTKNEYAKFDAFDQICLNINTMAAELSKNEMLKNDFISNVSHEIKTPLAIIQNYAKLLSAKTTSENKRKEYLDGLVFQTQKLSELISNILKLSKLENQKIVPEIEQIDLAELVRTCALSFENLIEKKNLELVCKIDECTLSGSSSLLEIVFNNLISNAIKFTEPNGKITISLQDTDKSAIVKVADTGCGISKEIGEHIFEKFYQGDTSRSSEGNGLGLALVKQVIDLVGGEITVESKLKKGSTFSITLKKE